MADIVIKRHPSANGCTIGELTFGQFTCYTCEDIVRDGVKIYGETAIPAGTYEVAMTWSPKFNKMMPEVRGVPNYSGVRFHVGNTAKDTEGCILLGFDVYPSGNGIAKSTAAFAMFYSLLTKALAAGPVHVTIK